MPIVAPLSLHTLAIEFRSPQDGICSCDLEKLQLPGLKFLELGNVDDPSSKPHMATILANITATPSLSRIRCHINEDGPTTSGWVTPVLEMGHWPSTLESVISHPVDVEIVSSTSPFDLSGAQLTSLLRITKIRTLSLVLPSAAIKRSLNSSRLYISSMTPESCHMSRVDFRITHVADPAEFERCAEVIHGLLDPLLGTRLNIFLADKGTHLYDTRSPLGQEQVIPELGYDVVRARYYFDDEEEDEDENQEGNENEEEEEDCYYDEFEYSNGVGSYDDDYYFRDFTSDDELAMNTLLYG